MPKNPVTNPITHQEIARARLIPSGTIPRAAVNEKLINPKAEGLRDLNLGRDQILARLWYLANLDPEATRGSIAGQIKALSMIVAIEGLIPNRRLSAVAAQAKPAAPQLPAPHPLRPAPASSHGAPPPNLYRDQASCDSPLIDSEAIDRAFASMGRAYDVHLQPAGSFHLPLPLRVNAFAHAR